MRRENARETRREKRRRKERGCENKASPARPSRASGTCGFPRSPLFPPHSCRELTHRRGKRGPRAGWEEKGRDGAAGSSRRGPHACSLCWLCTKRNTAGKRSGASTGTAAGAERPPHRPTRGSGGGRPDRAPAPRLTHSAGPAHWPAHSAARPPLIGGYGCPSWRGAGPRPAACGARALAARGGRCGAEAVSGSAGRARGWRCL